MKTALILIGDIRTLEKNKKFFEEFIEVNRG